MGKQLKIIENNNVKRFYYPDFYLPKFNLYLDPKTAINRC